MVSLYLVKSGTCDGNLLIFNYLSSEIIRYNDSKR
jgi:hypothetical protein